MSKIDNSDYVTTKSIPSNDKVSDLEEFSSSFKNGVKDSDSSSVGTNQMKKNFSNVALAMIGFSLTNSWLGISSSLVTGIQSGGPVLIVYGIIIVASISLCIGSTLGEMASLAPSAGGQYTWARILAPKRYANFWAYITGSISWGGSIFTTASMCLAVSLQLLGFWNLSHPNHVTQKWEIFIIYNIMNWFLFLFNIYHKFLPLVGNSIFTISISSYCIILITVLVCSRGNYQDAHFVFVEFTNGTGWPSKGIAFIVGLINPAWSFSCLDSVTHLSEETAQPERDIPKAVMSTVVIGFVTAFTYSIAMFYCITDLDLVINSTTGMPILDIYYQALNNKVGAICLGSLVFLTASGCTIASQTWQARLCWSFARDNGLPMSKYLSIIDPKTGSPLYAHIFSTVIVSVVSVLVFSDAAFQATALACVSFLLIAYSIPTIFLLMRKRQVRPGPFWLGKFGYFCNIVLLCWTVFALVFFSFPAYYPVTAEGMNYFCVVLFVYVICMLVYWWFPIKKYACKYNFRGGEQFQEETEFPNVCINEW
ncbi:HNM1 [Candida pseudojiufengensis]|uniref:HNM1 n=1 Tax=Candida pseudojiufengensis TaxID=497109 RepID=UPI0022252D22|nr:HNM1 [Candida pseudojiufengensis]KAI5960653.1 HNM1 [Candida pseudojiufengensis]